VSCSAISSFHFCISLLRCFGYLELLLEMLIYHPSMMPAWRLQAVHRFHVSPYSSDVLPRDLSKLNAFCLITPKSLQMFTFMNS